jgi:hypothetical protein
MTTPAIWFRVNNGNWNNDPSADPTTQVGGLDISSITGPYLPFCSGSTNSFGNFSNVINAGGSPFSFTAPSGSAPLGATITWNPSDQSGLTLSGGNLEATASGGLFGASGWIRATQGAAGGLQYYEQTLTLNTGTFFAGVADAAATISTGGAPGAGDGTISYSISAGGGTGAGIVIGGDDVLVTGMPLAETGDVLGIAIFTAGTPPPTPTPTTPAVVIPQGLGLWRGQCGINWQGLALVGDAFTNVVGLSDFTVFSEYGNQMRMLVTSPPIHKDRKRVSIPRFEIEVEAGLGSPGLPEVPPLMLLDYSKDGGITWVPLQMFRSMGAAGEYIKRLRWINLGNARTWVFRLQYTSPARPAIIGSYMDLFVNLG